MIDEKTSEVLHKLIPLSFVREYTLVGGTALALQIFHRISVDIDLMIWKKPDEKFYIDWKRFEREFQKVFQVVKVDVIDENLVNFILDGIKVTFYGNLNDVVEMESKILYKSNDDTPDALQMVDMLSISGMKIDVMQRRKEFKDYYDLYSICIEAGLSMTDLIDQARNYNRHLKDVRVVKLLTDASKFKLHSNFHLLKPKHPTDPKIIGEYFDNLARNYRATIGR